MNTYVSRTGGWICGLCLAMLATVGNATPMNIHLAGMVPLSGSADDFHMRVVIAHTFLLGEPINLMNGPFDEGVTTSTDTGFTVDWEGAGVTGGGPYPFGFDFLVNTTEFRVSEAYWTVSGRLSERVDPSLFNFFATPAPEPASLALLALGLAGLGFTRRRK